MEENNRRSVLKSFGIGAVWSTPVIQSVILPAHAQTSPGVTTPKPPPVDPDVDPDGETSKNDVPITIKDFNSIQDDFYDLYINGVFIGVVNNPPGGSTTYNVTLLSGINTIELRLTAPQGDGTLLNIDINSGEFSDNFGGTHDHIYNIKAP